MLLYEGFLHQILRDVGFMVPDLLNIYLPIQELKLYAKKKKAPASYLITNKMALSTLTTAFSIWFIITIIRHKNFISLNTDIMNMKLVHIDCYFTDVIFLNFNHNWKAADQSNYSSHWSGLRQHQ